MSFRPAVGDTLQINGITYTVAAHPQSPMYPYAQEGGRATVYRLDAPHGARALKVFKSVYRTRQVAESSRVLERFSTLMGMGVCRREVLAPTADGRNPLDESDLAWSVLMPWVEGATWYDILTESSERRRPIDILLMRGIVQQFLNILIELELNGVTHCDLSPGNVLIRLRPPEVDLIDVEEVCALGMPIPENIPRGTPGYMHASAIDGMWHPYADRFAGALLLCEMIGWSSAEFQAASYGDSFFAPTEMQKECDRYHVMCRTLRQLGGGQLVAVFQRCWSSKTLDQTPAFWEWALALQHEYFRKVMPSQPPSNDVLSAQVQYTVRELQRALLYAPPSLTQEARRGLQKTLQWLDPTASAPHAQSRDIQKESPAHVHTPSRAVDPPVLSSSESNAQTASLISSPVPNRWVVIAASLVASMVIAGVLVFGVWGDTGRTASSSVQLNDEQIVAISAGWIHSLALTKSGEAVAWGGNSDGQTDIPSELRDVKAVAAGANSSFALTMNDKVVTWGVSTYGTDYTNHRHSNCVVEQNGMWCDLGLRDVVEVSTGNLYLLALTKSGEVVAWGWNEYGQTDVPSGLRDVVAISSGFHSLALTKSGEVVAWGWNEHGQTDVPSGLRDVVAVAAGNAHSLALTKSGKVIAWGSNADGQLNVPESIRSPLMDTMP